MGILSDDLCDARESIKSLKRDVVDLRELVGLLREKCAMLERKNSDAEKSIIMARAIRTLIEMDGDRIVGQPNAIFWEGVKSVFYLSLEAGQNARKDE